MDYEKKYKEALERAKHSDGIYPSTKELKEYIFPELRESEDGKIRKEIISFLKNQPGQTIPTSQYDSWLCWLEKQREQKSSWSEEDERNLDWLMTVCERIHYKSDPQVAPDSALMLRGWLKSLKDRVQPQIKQKWSEYDSEHINSLLKRLEGMCKKGATFTRTRFAVSEDIDWLKSLRPQNTWKPSEAQLIVLDDVIKNAHLSNANETILKGLQEQLKKL